MTEKILTLHPDPSKKGVNIDRAKYDLVRQSTFDVLGPAATMKPMTLFEAVADHLKGQMEGSIKWYAVSVKLDMEARGEIEHDRKKGQCWLTGAKPNPEIP